MAESTPGRCGVHDTDQERGVAEGCFRCKLLGVQFGYTYGRETFHGPTDRERATEIREGWKERHGYYPEPAGARWV